MNDTKEKFQNLDEAIVKLNSFNNGNIIRTESGNFRLLMDMRTKVDTFYKSETNEALYSYTIEKYSDHCILWIVTTFKNKMVTAAKNGDLKLYKDNFQDNKKMRDFTLSEAIYNGHWSIIEFLIEHGQIEENPIWNAIRFNKVEIMCKLFDKGFPIPPDWLAYCIYNDSFEVAQELLLKREKHLEFNALDLKTSFYHKEIKRETKTALLIKQIMEYILKKFKNLYLTIFLIVALYAPP